MTEVLVPINKTEYQLEAEKKFYDKPFYFSYSSLNKLLFDPSSFYKMYVLGEREEKTDSYLVQGKIIHGMILENDKFDQNFIISPTNLPDGKARILTDMIFKYHVEVTAEKEALYKSLLLSDYTDKILEVMTEIDYYQSLKTDAQRIDKVVTLETGSYFNFLKNKGNKTLIDQESYDYCKNAVDVIKQMPNIIELLGLNVTEFDNITVENELALQRELSKYPFGLKGVIDNLKIDHDTKIIYINDLKTTGKTLSVFSESIEYFSYWLQAIVYCYMVHHQYQNLIKDGYKIKFHFVVIDKFFKVYPFPVSEDTLIVWEKRAQQVLKEATHHYTTRRYELPYQFDKCLVTL